MYSLKFFKNNFLIEFFIFFLLIHFIFCNPLLKEQDEVNKSISDLKNNQDSKSARTARSNSKIEFVYLDSNGNLLPKQNVNIKNLLANSDNDLSIDPKNRNSDKSILINKDIDSSIDRVIQITSYNNDKPDEKTDDLHYSSSLKQSDHPRHKSKFNHDKPIVIPIKVRNENTFSIPPFVNSESKNSLPQSLKIYSENQPSFQINQPYSQENFQNPILVPNSYPLVNSFLDFRSLSHPYQPIYSPVLSQSASDQYLNYPSVFYPIRNNFLPSLIQFSSPSINRVLDDSKISYNNVEERLLAPYFYKNYLQSRPISSVFQPTSLLATQFMNPFSSFLLPQQTPNVIYYQDLLNSIYSRQFNNVLVPSLNPEFSNNLASIYQQYPNSLINGKKNNQASANPNEAPSPFADNINSAAKPELNTQNFANSSPKIPEVMTKSNEKPLLYSSSNANQILPIDYSYSGSYSNRYFNQPFESQPYYYRYSQPIYNNRYQSYNPYYNSYIRPSYNDYSSFYNPSNNYAYPLHYSAEKNSLSKNDQTELVKDDKKNVDDLMYSSMNIKDLLKEKANLKNSLSKNGSDDDKKSQSL